MDAISKQILSLAQHISEIVRPPRSPLLCSIVNLSEHNPIYNSTSIKTYMGNNFCKMVLADAQPFPPPAVMGSESIMKKKAHGTSAVPVQENLRWQCDREVADRICNFNRHYAEHSGYFKTRVEFLNEADATPDGAAMSFFDSNTGKLLFTAPRNRSMKEFLEESRAHGWPSFRDAEVNWEFVRVLPNGETVSVDGTHLGHNLPDRKGSRYCINLVCVAGRPSEEYAPENESSTP